MKFEVRDHDEQHSPVGPARLFIDGDEVGSADIKTQPGFFGLEGVITVGRATGIPPTTDYESRDTFHGGVIDKVTVSIHGDRHRDLEKEAAMASRRD